MVRKFLRSAAFKILGKNQINYIRFSSFVKKLSSLLDGHKPDGVYEPEMDIIKKIIKNPEICLDIGANYGSYTTILSKNFPDARIFSFEPIDDSFKILSKVKSKFNLQNVYLFNLGISDEAGEMLMEIPGGITGQAHLINKEKEINKNTRNVKITTIDNFVEKGGLKKVDFIKCDVEGVELKVFKGGLNVLKTLRPIVLCEIEKRHMRRYNIVPDEIINFLNEINYRIFYLENNRLISTKEISDNNPNYFLIPSEKIKRG